MDFSSRINIRISVNEVLTKPTKIKECKNGIYSVIKGPPPTEHLAIYVMGRALHISHVRYVLCALKDCEYCEWIVVRKTLFTIYFMRN